MNKWGGRLSSHNVWPSLNHSGAIILMDAMLAVPYLINSYFDLKLDCCEPIFCAVFLDLNIECVVSLVTSRLPTPGPYWHWQCLYTCATHWLSQHTQHCVFLRVILRRQLSFFGHKLNTRLLWFHSFHNISIFIGLHAHFNTILATDGLRILDQDRMRRWLVQ